MARISCKRHRLPATVIQHAGWPYFRFTLSLRDVEEMLAQRSIDASCGTIRAWTLKSVPKIAADLRRRKQPPSPRGCHDEMVCRIGGEEVFLWRAVDDESEVPDPVVQKRRDTREALKPLKQLLRSQPAEPEIIVTDGPVSYSPALRAPGREGVHRPGRLRENDRAGKTHLPIRRRERTMLGFKSQSSAQQFLTTHAAIQNAFHFQRHMISRPALRIFLAPTDPVSTKEVA
jgi:putative transposase